MQTVLPKPFLPVGEVPLLVRTLQSLTQSALITGMVIVVAPEREELCRTILATHGPFGLPIQLVQGGEQRQDSVRLGLAALDPGCEIVVIHDAARPFIAVETIERSIATAAKVGGALVAVPARDTIKRVGADGMIVETVPRQELWLAQTPQTFRFSLLREAHRRAATEGILATDDAALVERIGGQVQVVLGDAQNFKITTPEDLRLAEALVKAEAKRGVK